MKVAIIGDLHLSLIDKRPWFDANRVKTTWNRMMRSAKKRGCRSVILLGDVHDSYNPSKKADQLLFELLLPYANEGMRFHIIAGNHDFGRDRSCSLDFLESVVNILGLDNIKVYKEPTVSLIDGIYFNFLPYPHKEPYLEGSPCINVAHIDKVDARYHNDYRVKATQKNVSLLDSNIWWIGHIHKRQNLGVDKTTRYVGTPWQASWMEQHKDRSFTVADITVEGKEAHIDYSVVLTKPDFQLVRIKPDTQKELDSAHADLASFLGIEKEDMKRTYVFVEINRGLIVPQHKWSYAESIVQFKGVNRQPAISVSKALEKAREVNSVSKALKKAREDDFLDSLEELDPIENVLRSKLESIDESPRVKARAKDILDDILKAK